MGFADPLPPPPPFGNALVPVPVVSLPVIAPAPWTRPSTLPQLVLGDVPSRVGMCNVHATLEECISSRTAEDETVFPGAVYVNLAVGSRSEDSLPTDESTVAAKSTLRVAKYIFEMRNPSPGAVFCRSQAYNVLGGAHEETINEMIALSFACAKTLPSNKLKIGIHLAKTTALDGRQVFVLFTFEVVLPSCKWQILRGVFAPGSDFYNHIVALNGGDEQTAFLRVPNETV